MNKNLILLIIIMLLMILFSYYIGYVNGWDDCLESAPQIKKERKIDNKIRIRRGPSTAICKV
jgi:hypothetical protein